MGYKTSSNTVTLSTDNGNLDIEDAIELVYRWWSTIEQSIENHQRWEDLISAGALQVK
jgi:hypothetical protein